MKANYKISFCTVCMNRLNHLMQTLKKNIDDNGDYNNLEFVILDYNSSDGLEDYIQVEMYNYINNGQLIYYKTTTPQYFDRSHSRNLVYKLATGDIVCNVDADNFIGKGFATYINNEFSNDANIFLSMIENNQNTSKLDILGRICVKRNDFIEIKGYDERMKSYGFEDYDLVNRLKLRGLKNVSFPSNADFFNTIKHKNHDRLSNEYIAKNLKALLVNYLTPASSDVIFLFNDNKFKKGIVIDNQNIDYHDHTSGFKNKYTKYEYSILQNEWLVGEWRNSGDEWFLYQNGNIIQTLYGNRKEDCLISSDNNNEADFYFIKNNILIEEMIMFCGQVLNRALMYKNILYAKSVVNIDFGKDKVYKNFDCQKVIDV